MNKLLSFVCGAALVGGSVAHAADTSATINVRKAITPVGVSPQIGIVEATATATGSFTVDLPLPSGRKASDIIGVVPVVYDTSGSVKPVRISVSGSTVTVAGSQMASGTVAIGDKLKVTVTYNP